MKYGHVEWDSLKRCYRIILPGGMSAGFKTETRAHAVLRQIRATRAE